MIEHPASSCVLAGEPLPAGAISMPVGAEVLLERLLDRRRPEIEYKVGKREHSIISVPEKS